MSTVPVDLVHIISSATELDLGDSPGHNDRPVIFLQQLRENSDYRTCDIDVLLTGGEREHLHSIIGCAHSGNLQRMVSWSDSIPVLLDMTEYSVEAVHRVIDWMYFGRVSCREEELVDLLRVSYFMGVTFFRRQLDLILRKIGKSGPKKLVKMFNIATRTDCGLSKETLKQLMEEMAERSLTQEELFQLRSRSILAMVTSAEVKLKTKAHLITLAVRWLNNPRREANVEEVITAVAVPQMDYEDLEALKSSLRSTITNPLMRRYVRIEERDGRLRLIVEPDDVVTSVNNSTDESDRTSRSQKMKAQVKSWWERSKENRKSTSNRSKKNKKKKIINLPDVIKKGERTRIRALPNAFSSQHQRSFTDTELKQIRNLPDFFDESFKLRNSRSFTNTELEEINALPDMFKKAGRARSFTTTEREEINALPDMFKKAGRARSFTTTEREEINALPDVFVESDEDVHDERKKNQLKVTKLSDSNVVSSGSIVSTLCPPAPPVSLVTDDGASTARSFSDIDISTHGKCAGSLVEMEFRQKKEVKRSDEDDEELKKTNSSYINLPKGRMSDSFYAI